MKSIFRQEFSSFFHSLYGWAYAALSLLLFGIFTVVNNLYSGYANFEYVINSMLSMTILLTPILSMRSIADERRSGTEVLLYSTPIRLWEVVAGKYLACFACFLIPVAIVSLYPLVLSLYGDCPLPLAYNAVLGYLFLGAALIALGVFCSSLTRSPIVASVLHMGFMLLALLMANLSSVIPQTESAAFWLLAGLLIFISFGIWRAFRLPGAGLAVLGAGTLALILARRVFPAAVSLRSVLNGVIRAASVFDWMECFVVGILDLRALLYYASLTALFLLFAVQILERRRWL